MKLIAMKGSKLEQVIKKMWEQLVSDENAAKEFIKERVGVMPEALSFIWVFGDTSCFVCQDIIFAKDDWENRRWRRSQIKYRKSRKSFPCRVRHLCPRHLCRDRAQRRIWT